MRPPLCFTVMLQDGTLHDWEHNNVCVHSRICVRVCVCLSFNVHTLTSLECSPAVFLSASTVNRCAQAAVKSSKISLQ